MGASQDRTAGYAGTALLERGRGRTTLTPPKPRFAPHVPRPSRLGSKQVVSVRGRRVTTTETKRKFSRMSILSLPLLLLGIFGAMLLSALSTQQTFTIQQLQSEERALKNEIETLNRDVEDSRAAAEVAAKAGQEGMVVPSQAGIITVNNHGEATEVGPADPEKTLRVVDVNGDTVRVDRATSDRSATDNVVDNLSPLPAPAVLQSLPGVQ